MTTADRAVACGHEHEDGAYVLGALSLDDRVAFERHLPGCPGCAESVRKLAGLPGLLARVPGDTFDPGVPPASVPETLLPGLLRRAQRTRRRQRWVTGGLVAAAVAAAFTVGAVGVAVFTGDDPVPPAAAGVPTAAPQLLKPVGNPPIAGWLSLTKVGWGTRLDLTCSYPGGDAYHDAVGPTYVMYVMHADGTSEQVASWRAVPGKTLHLAAATAASAGDIADVEVRTADGTTVLDLG